MKTAQEYGAIVAAQLPKRETKREEFEGPDPFDGGDEAVQRNHALNAEVQVEEWQCLKPHELAGIYPDLAPEEYDALVSDIHQNGLADPIVLFEGHILDGRHRHRALCDLLDLSVQVKPRFWAFEGTEVDAFFYVHSKNAHRRNLTTAQRACLAYEYKKAIQGNGLVKHGGDRSKQDAENGVLLGEARMIAANKFGVGKTAVDKAEKLALNAPLVYEQARDGLYKKLSEAEAEAAKQEQEARVQQAVEAMPSLVGERYRVFTADVAALDETLEANSVDVILTDPPYPKEYLHVYDSLARTAAKVLKEGGSMYVMVGQSYLPQIMQAMTPHLDYRWTLAYMTPGAHTQIWQRKVMTGWKPILWFTKGKADAQWSYDVARSESPDKAHHEWGQSESGLADLMGLCTKPGDTVLDPFCGGGSTGAVAIRMDRQFIGSDIDEKYVKATAVRLEELVGNT